MAGIGTVSAGEMFSEQVELKGRTTDPANAEPGEYWVRVDQTSSNPQVVAELRRQDTSGVTKIPLFADSEEANLGSQMVRGPSVVLDGGTVGFITQTTDSGAAYGSPRVVTASGAEYLSHDSLTLTAIPDTAVRQWPLGKRTNNTIEETQANDDGTVVGNPANTADSNFYDGYYEATDGNDDALSLPLSAWRSQIQSNDWGLAVTIRTSNLTRPFGTSDSNFDNQLTFFDSSGTPRWEMQLANSTLQVDLPNTTIDDGTLHRLFVRMPSASASNFEFYLDNSSQDTTVVSDQVSDWSTWDTGQPMYFGAENNGGSVFDPQKADYSNIILYDSPTTSTVEDDYKLLP